MESKLVVDRLMGTLKPMSQLVSAAIMRALTMRHKSLWAVTHLQAVLCKVQRQAARSENVREHLRHREVWYQGIFDEVLWWEGWLTTEGGLQWMAEAQCHQRLVREPLLVKRLGDLTQGSVSVLDVGSGPMTCLGNTFPGKVLEVVATDPLANVYRKILSGMGVTPSMRTLPYHGEQLLEYFAPESFDFVYARNALDHSYNPVLVIQGMLAVVKRQGTVLLRHYRNEGKIGDYAGLHQWNFDLQGDSLIVWNESRAYDISQMFRQQARIECYLEDSRHFGGFDHSEWVVCAMEKMAGTQKAT